MHPCQMVKCIASICNFLAVVLFLFGRFYQIHSFSSIRLTPAPPTSQGLFGVGLWKALAGTNPNPKRTDTAGCPHPQTLPYVLCTTPYQCVVLHCICLPLYKTAPHDCGARARPLRSVDVRLQQGIDVVLRVTNPPPPLIQTAVLVRISQACTFPHT